MWNATAEWVQGMFCEMQLHNFISVVDWCVLQLRDYAAVDLL